MQTSRALTVLLGGVLLLSAACSGGDATGDDLAAAELAAQTGNAQPQAPATQPDADADEPQLPVETYEVYLTRDPFEPLLAAASDQPGTGQPGAPAPGAPGDGGAPAPGDDTPIVLDVFTDSGGTPRATLQVGGATYTVGVGDAFGDGYLVLSIDDPCVTLERNGDVVTACETGDPAPGGSGSDPCTGTDEVVCDGAVVTLVDVIAGDPARAIVQVDTTAYEVGEGDTFAGSFLVLTIDPPCVTMLYGDDAFTLCEGQQVLK